MLFFSCYGLFLVMIDVYVHVKNLIEYAFDMQKRLFHHVTLIYENVVLMNKS